MLDIKIRTIADQLQRYNTVGDYQTDEDGSELFSISDMGDARYEFLIAIHELVESMLCKERGITEAAIDAFDTAYEANRPEGDITSEAGDDPAAPYNKEHVFATKIEWMVAEELGVDWDVYCQACAQLTKE